MQFYPDVAAVQVWTVLKNEGSEEIGLEYVSSFIYQGLCQNGTKPYYEKTSIYTPHNSWYCESQWRKNDCREINLSGMTVNGFHAAGFGMNRYCYGGYGSWSTCEYLPMGICEDTECQETYFFGSNIPVNGLLSMDLPLENGYMQHYPEQRKASMDGGRT